MNDPTARMTKGAEVLHGMSRDLTTFALHVIEFDLKDGGGNGTLRVRQLASSPSSSPSIGIVPFLQNNDSIVKSLSTAQ